MPGSHSQASHHPAIHEIELVGGHCALDCVNTVHSWSGDRPGDDYLVDYATLLEWHLRLELISERQAGYFRAASARTGAAVLGQFRDLRRNLHGLFRSVALELPMSGAGLENLDRFLTRTQPYRRLVERADTAVFEWTFRDAPASALCGPVAWQAAELLTSGPLDRIKECSLPEGCGWLFLDTSRNRSRQWCNMKTCGNLAKVRRFRARHGG